MLALPFNVYTHAYIYMNSAWYINLNSAITLSILLPCTKLAKKWSQINISIDPVPTLYMHCDSSRAGTSHQCLWLYDDPFDDGYFLAEIMPLDRIIMRPRQSGRHIAVDISKSMFVKENVCSFIQISLKFVPISSVGNKPQNWLWLGTETATRPYLNQSCFSFTEVYMRHSTSMFHMDNI